MTDRNDWGRDYVASYELKGNQGVAQSYRRLAQKLVGKVMNQIDEGTNLGQGVSRSFPVNDYTTIDVVIHEGVTNPIVKVIINAGFETPVITEEMVSGGGMVNCPELPHGEPGRRMFTQVLKGDGDEDPWEEVLPEVVNVPDGNNWCGGGPNDGFWGGDRSGYDCYKYTFPEDEGFWYLGVRRREFYFKLCEEIFFKGPRIMADPYVTPVIDAQCTWDRFLVNEYLGFEDEDGPRIGSGYGAGCGNTESGWHPVIRRGWATLPTVDLITGEVTVVQRKFTSVTNRTTGPPKYSFWSNREVEIVLLDLQDTQGKPMGGACSAAVGIFYGGPDGQEPWEYQEWLGLDPSDCNNPWDVYFTQEYCDISGEGPVACPGGQRGPGGAGGFFLTGDNWQAQAWIARDGRPGLNASDEAEPPANPSAQEWANSRSVWFYLDAEGYPLEGQGSDSKRLSQFHWR